MQTTLHFDNFDDRDALYDAQHGTEFRQVLARLSVWLEGQGVAHVPAAAVQAKLQDFLNDHDLDLWVTK